jgi:hypothetical protein
MAPIGSVLLAPSPAAGAKYDLTYYVKAAAAGGICCSITHGALTPVDGRLFVTVIQQHHPLNAVESFIKTNCIIFLFNDVQWSKLVCNLILSSTTKV